MHPLMAVVIAIGLLATACSEAEPTSKPPGARPPSVELEPGDVEDGLVRTTSGDQTGNRVTIGSLDLGGYPLRVEVDVEPRWVVGGRVGVDRSVYVVVSVDGSVTEITVDGSGVSTVTLDPREPDSPPSVLFGSNGYRLIRSPVGASPFTAPALVGDSLISVTIDGEVTVSTVGETVTVTVAGLGDSRLVVDERNLIAVLSDPTGDYPHGVVGDRVESATVTIFDAVSAEIVGVARAPEGTVFETVAPMWADVDGDGDSELLVTASDSLEGARLLVFDERGEPVAASPPIGRGQRWRNQLGVAPMGGGPAIVDVQTPHIGGIVQWFRLEGATLAPVAAAEQYSSHRIGRRNLDQGLIVDGDGDGTLDVVVPSQDQRSLAVLSLKNGEATESRRVGLDSRLSSNLSAFAIEGGGASLAVGLEGGTVLIWP